MGRGEASVKQESVKCVQGAGTQFTAILSGEKSGAKFEITSLGHHCSLSQVGIQIRSDDMP